MQNCACFVVWQPTRSTTRIGVELSVKKMALCVITLARRAGRRPSGIVLSIDPGKGRLQTPPTSMGAIEIRSGTRRADYANDDADDQGIRKLLSSTRRTGIRQTTNRSTFSFRGRHS